ncbi:hypothetical protein N9966_00815, partial [bacterium]|nr:hypothetical protein [bacterium]
FIKDKTDLFGEISATKALFENFPELNKSVNSYQSIKSNKGNIIPTLLDLLKELIGSNIQKQFNELLKKTDKIEEGIKKTIIKEVLKKAKKNNFKLSDINNPVLNTKIKNIDVDGTLKMDPNSDMGKFYYGKAAPTLPNLPNDPTIQVSPQPGGDFQKFLFDSAKTGSGNWKNILNVNWTDDNLKVSIDPSYLLNKSFENFLRDFLDSVKILDLSLLVSSTLDMLFGTVSSLTDAGGDWLEDKFKLKELTEKVIDKEGLATSTTPVIYNNDFFQFSKTEKDNIRNLTNSVINGGNLADLGCGKAPTLVDFNDFVDNFNNLQSAKPSLIKETLTKSLDSMIGKSVGSVSEENEEVVKQNIFGQIFDNLTSIILGQTFKPFNTILQQMGEGLLNTAGIDPNGQVGSPGVDIDSPSVNKSGVEDYFAKFKSLNVCLIKEAIYPIIVEFLFDIVKAEIIKLVAIKIAQIQADQTKNYKEQLESAREALKQVSNILSFINSLTG